MGEFGQRLRQARERAGLSLSELSSRTKIRERLLEAIERGDFNQFPPGLLTRGLLRAYAREVGLDPEAVVREYGLRSSPATSEPPPMRPPERIPSRPVPDRSLARAAVTVIILAAATAMLLVSLADDAGAPEVASEAVATESEEVRPDRPHEPLVPADATQVVDVRPANALWLEISPTGPVWVEATTDGERVLYRLLHPGERQRLEALDELLVRIGDAGAFQYTINGERGRPLGAAAEVRDIRITRDSYTTFQER